MSHCSYPFRKGKQIQKKSPILRQEMGNCIGLQEPVTWVDDEEDDGWGLNKSKLSVKRQEEEAASRNAKKKVQVSTEVKIRISKKQLEELLRQADAQGLPLRQVLAGLVGELGRPEELEKHWRPKLRTIPEVAELNY